MDKEKLYKLFNDIEANLNVLANLLGLIPLDRKIKDWIEFGLGTANALVDAAREIIRIFPE